MMTLRLMGPDTTRLRVCHCPGLVVGRRGHRGCLVTYRTNPSLSRCKSASLRRILNKIVRLDDPGKSRSKNRGTEPVLTAALVPILPRCQRRAEPTSLVFVEQIAAPILAPSGR